MKRRDPATMLKDALGAYAAGQHERAESMARQIVRVAPKLVDAVHLVAVSCANRGAYDEAIVHYDRAIALMPRSVAIMNNRARTLVELKRFDEALEVLDRILAAQPDTHESLNNRGNALQGLARYEEAVESYRAALRHAPDHPQYHNNLANALRALRREAEALVHYDRALAAQPGYADAWNNRGVLLMQMGRYDEAIASLTHALELAPRHPVFLNNRGPAYTKVGRHEDAVRDFEVLLEADPDFEYAQGRHFAARAASADWRDWDRVVGDATAAVLAGRRAVQPFTSLWLTDDPAVHLAAARTWAAEYVVPPLELNRERERSRDRRLRVAYLSQDFGNHPVGHLIAPVLEAHSRDSLEVYCVAMGPSDGSAERVRIERGCDKFFDAAALSDAGVARALAELRVDLIVNLMGFTGEERLTSVAHRPAPIAVNYLGFPGTLGADACDYVIADRYVIPPEAEAHYAERVVRLPGCYLPAYLVGERPPRLPARADLGLPEAAVVLCAFHTAYKIHPALFEAWLDLLERVPDAVLWLQGQNPVVRQRLLAATRRRGIAAERLVFAGYVPDRESHLARLSAADVYLDAFPYNAHSTAAEALLMGVPVVTWSGGGFASRVAGSLVTTFGLADLVATTRDGYVGRAAALASDRPGLAAVRRRLLAAGGAPFDVRTYARGLEAAYRTMWHRYCDGLPPTGLDVAL
jgi:predicted O-linked N-acetylglucosamine transferase (SPINDLY family)